MVLFSIVYNAKHACAVFRALVLSRVSVIISCHHCFRLRDALCVVSPAPIGYYLEPGFVFCVCGSLFSHRRGAGVCPEEPRTLGSSAHLLVSSPSRFLLDACQFKHGLQPARARVCPEEPRVTQLFQPALPYCSPARIHCSSSPILLPIA